MQYTSLSVFSRVDQYFYFMTINVENTNSQKYIVQNGRCKLETILEVIGYPILIQTRIHEDLLRLEYVTPTSGRIGLLLSENILN